MTRTIEVVTGGTYETILKYFAEAEQDSELKERILQTAKETPE